MNTKLPRLIATSVVRGSQQGESHGGVYTIDFENQKLEQRIDWNTSDIDLRVVALIAVYVGLVSTKKMS